MDPKLSRAASAAEIPGGAGAPAEILLLPAGEIPTRPHDGRAPWRNPDPAAVVAATRELATDIAIDYDHQGLRAAENGQAAPAAGWIKRVFERAGAIWGEVEWTERAAAMIKAREYRFISPVFQFDKATRTVRRIVGAGLTNDPALYMRAIANAQPEEESEMDLEKLREALGLSKTASVPEIVAAATAAAMARAGLAKIAKALGADEDAEPDAILTATSALVARGKAVAKAAGLAEDATAADVEKAVSTAVAAAAAGDVDPTKFVPRSEFDQMQSRLAAIETGTAAASATAKVDQAVKDGKVMPASRDWALALAAKDPESFDKFLEGAPKILGAGRVAPADPAPGGGDALTADEKAVCRATGVSEEDFVKSRKALAAAGEEG